MIPLVIVAMMFVVHAGLAYHARRVVAGAAQDGAAAGARYGSSPDQGVVTARALLDAVGDHLLDDVQVTPSGDSGTVTITVTADVVRVLPIFPGFHVSATSSAAVEQFRPQVVGP